MSEAKRDATFRALADPSRRRVLDELALGERTVSELCALFETTQPAISQHLRVLREAGLVRFNKVGRSRYYALDSRPIRHVYDWAARYTQFWESRLDKLGRVLAREAERKR